MDTNSKTNPLTIGIAIFVIILAGALVWYWQKEKYSSLTSEQQIDQKIIDISLGSQILKETKNLIKDKLPETNPFSDTEINPLKKIIKNPF